jgi:hypothetical protein
MPFSLADILLGAVLPGSIAFAVAWFSHARLTRDWQINFSLSAALVLGFLAGYFSLQLGPWLPESHWQWVPVAMLLSLIAAPLAGKRAPLVNIVIALGVTQASALMLVPTWEDLSPPRVVYLATWTILVILATWITERTAMRESSVRSERQGAVLLGLSLLGTAILAAHSGSLRFGQIAGSGFAALVGLLLAGFARKQTDQRLGYFFTANLLALSVLLISQVTSYSAVPLASFVLMALVPAAPILTSWRKNAGLRTAAGWWWHVAPALLFWLAALALAVIYENPFAEEAW